MIDECLRKLRCCITALPGMFGPYITQCEHKRRGDWIAGFTSKELCGDWVGDERLVFLMQVEEKMALADYFHDRRFQSRIPRYPPVARVYRCGDNIYRPLVRNAGDAREFEQLPNGHHGPDQKDHDLKGRYALIARRFAYFGVDTLRVPRHIRPHVPAGQSAHGTETRDLVRAKRFIDYVFSAADAPVMACPHQWPRADASWKTQPGDGPDHDPSGGETGSSSSAERGVTVGRTEDGRDLARHAVTSGTIASSHDHGATTSCSPRKIRQ